MNNFFEDIISKLKKEIEIEEIEVVDNSHKHIKHKSFSADKFSTLSTSNPILVNCSKRFFSFKFVFK